MTRIDVINQPNQEVDVDVIPSQEIEVRQDVVININPAPPYEGEYTVIPKVTEQILPTKDKLMASDMTIKSIPFFNVSNTSGGSTAYIGSEV